MITHLIIVRCTPLLFMSSVILIFPSVQMMYCVWIALIAVKVVALLTEETIIETTAPDTVPEETVVMNVETITLADYKSGISDICHVNLFGSFLICGTLIGLAIMRKIYGT